jgi:hypothetical protein
MFRVVLPPIISNAYNCIYSSRYLSHRYCYLPLSWKSWNRFECAVGGVRQNPEDWDSAFILNPEDVNSRLILIPEDVDTLILNPED